MGCGGNFGLISLYYGDFGLSWHTCERKKDGRIKGFVWS